MEREKRGSALARCLAIAAWALVAAFCLDAAIFRSGLYKRVLSPDSSAGSVAWMIRMERARVLANARRILVLGNSQQAEGFSARIAGRVLAPERIDIVNAGVPGSTVRDWFYMVRDLDPKSERYNVIAIPFTDYADLDYQELQTARIQDVNFLIGSLRLRDSWAFSNSFPAAKDRWTALRGVLWEGLTYREDVQDFLRAPRRRLASVAAYRAHGMEWQDAYGGIDKSLAGLTYDADSGAVQFAPGTPAETERFVRDRLNPRGVGVRGDQRAYLRNWLGKIEDRYRGKDVRFVLFRMPQYPVHLKTREADRESVVNRLKQDARQIVLPEGEFDWLEDPRYGADGAHLNARGRVLFSEAFGKKLGEVLSGFQPKSN